MTSTNDGKDVKSNQTSGPKGKTYYIELYKSLEAGLSKDCDLSERTSKLCDAWRRVHSLCAHSASSTHPHLLSWLQRHTARTVLQTEWQDPTRKDEHKRLEEAIDTFIRESQSNDGDPPWQTQLVARGEWFKRILDNPWGHPVLRVLLDPERGETPKEEEVLEWLKEERGVMFVTRLRQLASSKNCHDLALRLASAVLDRVRACMDSPKDDQAEELKEKPKTDNEPTFLDILKAEAGFTVDVMEFLTDIEFVLLHKRDKLARCIELAKQTPLRNGYQLVERLQSRLETSPREKKLWKNAKEVATLIAQVVIARCMVVPVCGGVPRTALYCCSRSLARLVAPPRLPAAAAALAAPAATARHLHTLAAAVDAQCKEDMKPFVCELYVRAITAGMNELERFKLNADKESEARASEQTLSQWFVQLGGVLAASERMRCECTLTAFSVHPAPAMFDKIHAAPALPPVALDIEPKNEATTSEFGSWASDSRSQTNFVKTSETLKLKHTQNQANVLSTAILTEGEAIGLSPELCQDIAVLLSGPRLKTLSWDMDRQVLLDNCRAYMERTACGTRALTTELKFLNLDLRHYQHLPEEDDDDTDIYYGIEKGYEHLVEFQEPEDIWEDADDPERTTSAHTTDVETEFVKAKTKKKTKKIYISSADEDPLSFVAETKRIEKKKERPHSKERSKERKPKTKRKPRDPLEITEPTELIIEEKTDHSTERKTDLSTERKADHSIDRKEDHSMNRKEDHSMDRKKDQSVERKKDQSVERNKDLSVERNKDLSAAKNKNQSTEKKQRKDKDKKKEKKERKRKEKIVLVESKPSSLSSLIGMKVTKVGEQRKPIAAASSTGVTTDSNYDSQGKSSINSLISDGNDTDVVFDGLFSMDELKSPDKAYDKSDKMGIMKNNEVQTANGKVRVNTSDTKKIVTNRVPTPTLLWTNNKLIPQQHLTTVAEDVKKSISKLIHFRRQKALSESPEQRNLLASPGYQTYSNKNMRAQTSQASTSDSPKVCMSKSQSEQLTELRNEVNNFLNNKEYMSQPVIQYSQNQKPNFIFNNAAPSGVKILNSSVDRLLQQKPSTSNDLKVIPKTIEQPQKSIPYIDPRTQKPMVSHQKNYTDFVKELQKSINAGAGDDHTVQVKKEIKPISRVIPVLPKSEPKVTQSAKQSVKKSELAPNTFSRLSYYKSNKNDIKTKQFVESVIEHQNLKLQNTPKLSNLDRMMMEHAKAKSKHLHITSQTVAKPSRPSNNTQNITKSSTNTTSDHPTIASLLQSSSSTNTNKTPVNQYKTVERPRDRSTPLVNKVSMLSEKDQQDLVLLLRQQSKQNLLRPKQETPTERIPPSQSNTRTILPTYSAPSLLNKKVLDATTSVIKNNPTLLKPNQTLKASHEVRSVAKPIIVKTELSQTKNLDQVHNKIQKVEIIDNEGRSIKSKVITKHQDSSKPTDWESVMDAILKHKTPSRGPNALDMALNKDTYVSTFENNLRNQRIIRTPSCPSTELTKPNNTAESPAVQAKQAAAKTAMELAGHSPNILRRPITAKEIKRKSPKRSTKTQKVASNPATEVIINSCSLVRSQIPEDLTVLKPHTPKKIVTEKRQRDTTAVPKKVHTDSKKHQFTCTLSKQDDPFISGIPNSDYDLLEELMDDDLRQEIGELLSDEESYSASLQSVKDSKTFVGINKTITPVIQEDKRVIAPPVIAALTKPEFKKHVQKTVCQNTPKPVYETATPVQQSIGYVNVNTVMNLTEYTKLNINNANTPVHQIPKSVIVPPKKEQTYIATVPAVDHTIVAVPQQTALQNVVLIGSELVYQPCVQTPVHTGIAQNTFVTFGQPNIAVYQTTQFAAPVVNPLFIGRAITTPTVSVSVPIVKSAPSAETIPYEVPTLVPSSQEPQKCEMPKTSTDPKTETKSPVDYSPHDDISIKDKCDINSNKTCERKVLSEVQEKQKLSFTEKIESRNTKSRGVSFEHDVKKAADQERLKKKRMAILNRKIYHRSDDKPIPLTYMPLNKKKPELVTAQENNRASRNSPKMTDNNCIIVNLQALLNAKIRTLTELEKRPAKITEKDSSENCKENKSEIEQCRRILLRSSNKLSSEMAVKPSSVNIVPTKTNAKLKDDNSTTKSEDTNEIKSVKEIKKQGLNKTLNKAIKKMEIKKRITRQTIKNATNADHDTAEETKEDEKITTASDVETKPASHKGQTAVFEKTTSPDVDHEETAIIDDEKTAAIDLEKSESTDLEKTAAVDLEKTVAIDLKNTATIDFEKTAANDLDKKPAIDLKNTAAIDFEKTSAVDIENTAAIDVQKTFDVDFEKTVAVDVENTAAIDYEKTAANDLEKTRTIDFDKTVAIDTDKTTAIGLVKTADINLEKTTALNVEKSVAIDREITAALDYVKPTAVDHEKIDNVDDDKTETAVADKNVEYDQASANGHNQTQTAVIDEISGLMDIEDQIVGSMILKTASSETSLSDFRYLYLNDNDNTIDSTVETPNDNTIDSTMEAPIYNSECSNTNTNSIPKLIQSEDNVATPDPNVNRSEHYIVKGVTNTSKISNKDANTSDNKVDSQSNESYDTEINNYNQIGATVKNQLAIEKIKESSELIPATTMTLANDASAAPIISPGDQTEIANSAGPEKENKIQDNEPDIICLDDPNTDKAKTCAENLTTKEKNDKLPQSFIDGIKIEDLPNGSDDPLKKCVRIRLPNGRAFKATVRGQAHVNIDTLFADPGLKSVLLSNISNRNRYTLNIKQISTTIKSQPDKILETRIHEISLQPSSNPILDKCILDPNKVETINLLSDDDEDDDNCQYFKTEFGKYKVPAMKRKLHENHQKVFDKKCVVKLKREFLQQSFEIPSELTTMESDLTTMETDLTTIESDVKHQGSDMSQSKHEIKSLEPNVKPQDTEVIVPDDITSIVTTALPIATETYKFQDYLAKNISENRIKGPEVIEIDDSSNDDPRLNTKNISKTCEEKIRELKDLLFKDLAMELIDHNTPVIHVAPTQSIPGLQISDETDFQSSPPLPLPLVNANCYIKLTKCDKLVKKYNDLKSIKQCSVKLVRCDGNIQNDTSTNSEESSSEMDVDDDIIFSPISLIAENVIEKNIDMSGESISRCASLSILNDYSLFDQPLAIATHRSTSPVMEVYESIAALYNRETTEVKYEQWTCETEWFMSKLEFHLLNKRNNTIISESVRKLSVPSLVTILTKFFQDNHIETQYKPVNTCHGTLRYAKNRKVALSPSHHLKRKSLDNVQVDVKISKKSKGTNIVASCHEINVEIMTPKKTEKQKKEEIEGNTHDAFLLSADANIYYVHENPFHELHTTDSTMNGALAAYKHLSSFGNQLHDVFTEITDDEKSSNQASATLDFEHHVNSPSNTAGTKDSEQSRHNEEIVLQKTKESIDHDASAVPASSIVETHHTNIEDKRLSHCEIILTKINAEEDTISQMQLNENVINDLMAIEENTAINCEIDVNPSDNKYEATVISENSESLTSVSDPEKDTVTSTDLVVSEVLKQSNQCKEFISNKSYDTLVNCETFSPISQPDFSEVMVQESKGHIENDCEIIVPCESTDSMNDNISTSDEITIDESPTKSGEVINIDVTITKNCPSFNNEITNSEVLNEVMKNDLIQQIHEALQRPDEEIDFIDSSIETTLKLKETQEIGIVSSTNDIQMIPDTSNDEQVKLKQEDRELDIVSTQKGYPSHEVCDLEEQTVDGNSSIEADSTSIEYSIYSNNDHVPIDVNSTNLTVASEGADKVVLVDRPLIETDQMDYDNMDVKTAENMISSSTENITQNIVFKNDNYEETALTKENLIRNDDVLCNISSQLEDELYKNRTSANDNIIDNECIPNGHDIEVSKQCEVIKRMPEKSHDEIQKDPNTIETSNKDIEYNLIEDVNMCKKLLLEEELSQIVLGHGLSENQEDIYIDPQNQSNALSNNSNDVIKATTAFLEDMRQHLIDVLGSPIKNLSNPQIGDIIERQHLIDVLGSPIKNLSNPQIGDKIDLEKTPTIHNNNYEIKLDSNNVTEDIVNNHDGKIKKELTQKVTDDKNQQLNKEQEQTESVSEIKPECKEHDDEIKMNSPREVESVAFLDGAHNDLVDDVVDVRSNDELEQELARIVLGAADNANKQILNINADNLDIDEVKVCCVQPSELQKLMQMNIQDSKSNLNLDECEEPALYACSSIQEEEDIIQITQEMDEYGNVKEIDIRLNVPKITYSRKLSGRSYAYGALFGDRKKRGLKRKTDMADVKTPEKKYRKGKNIDTPKLTNAAMADTTYFKEFKRLFDYCSSVKFSYSRPFHKEYINVAKLLTEWPLNDISNIVIDSQIDDTLFTDTEIGIASYNDPLKQTLAEEIMKEYSESYNSSSEVNETNFQMGFGERSGRVIQNSGDVGGLKFSAATLSDVKQTQPLLLSEIYDNCNSEQDRNINTTKSEIEKLQRNYKCIQLKNKVRSFFKQTMVELNNDWNKQNDKHDDIYSNSNSEVDSSSFPFGLNLPDFIIPSPVEVVVQVVQVGQLPVSAAAQNPVTCDPRVTQVSDASPSQCSAENSPNDDPQSAVKTEYTELTTADISLPLQEYTQHHSRLPVDSDIHVHMSHDIVIDDIKEEIKAEIKEEPDLSDDFSDHFDNNDMINNGSSPMGNSSIVNSVEYLYNANAPHQEPTSETLSECTMEILFNSNDKPQGFENYLQQHQAAQLPQQNQAQLSQQTQQSQLSQQNHQAQLPQQNHHAQQPQQNHQAQFSHQNHQQQQPHQNQQAQLPQQNHQAQLPQQNKQVQLPQQNQQAQLPQQNQQAQLPQQSQQAQLPQQNQQAQHPHQNQQAQQQHQVQIVQQNQQAQLPQQHQQAQIQQQTQQGQQQQQNHQEQQNGSPEKTDQIAHAMNAAGITTNADNLANSRAHALVNILSQKLRQGSVQGTNSSTNSYQKTTQINAMALQQALAQILPPPLNQTGSSESNQQNTTNSPQVTSQVLHIVQGKNATGNQITLVDNSQPSVISTPNNTPVLHIVQNKSNSTTPTSNGTPAPQTNSFSGLSLVDAGLQQGNQLLHIVNAGNQKNNNAAQLLRKVNLLTNLANVQGSNEQKMVQFVCKSADGKSIQLNASHQRSMVLRLQPVDTPSLQLTQTKPADSQDMSPTPSTPNNGASKESAASQQEIKSRSVYEENYAKFIQSSNKPTVPEKATSLPKFGQAFGKQVFQDGNQKNDINNGNSHLPSSSENPDCQANDNAINLDHLSQMSSPPLLLRKSPQTSQAPPNLVQQLKQTISPMNMSMHGGVIYTRQIPVNIGGGQTINLITVPSTDLIDDSAPKHQGVNQEGMEPSIIKIVPQTPASTTEPTEESNSHTNVSNESGHTSQPQPVLTQMRIKLPMLSKTPQMVGGARLVRPSFFQIQRNVIGGANQPVYQQLVLTAAPPLGQQTIRLPQAQTNRPAAKVASDSQSSSSESQMSSSTLEQLREFDLVLEQVKERSTGTGNGTSTSTVQSTATSSTSFSKLHTPSTDTTDSSPSVSSSPAETTQQVLYSIGNTQPLNVAYVNRKAPSTSSTSSSFVRSPDSSGIVESPTSSTHQIPRTVTSESSGSDPPSNHTSHNSAHTTQGAHSTQSTQQPKPTKPKPKPRPKAASNPPNTLKLPPAPPKPSTQKPAEDEQTTQRILYILAEYKEQVENSPDKDKPAPRRRTNPPSNPGGSSKRKKSSSGSRRSGRDISPCHGEDTCRTMGSEDSSCGTSQGDCNESCLDSHSPQDSPRKVARKLTFEHEASTPISQPRPQPQRNVIVADGQTITVARGTAGKPTTAVLMPANYILPVSMVKGGQQIAIVTNRGPKLLTVGGGEGGATNALLLQRLIGPAGLKPVLARPGVRHVRLPTAALHNLQTFNLATTTTVQPPDSTASPAPAPTPPDLVDTRAASSPWRTERDSHDVKPERGSSPEGSEPWNLPPSEYSYEETVRGDNMDRTVLVVHKKDGSSHRPHRFTHVSAAALRHKYAILEHELRLQKSLSEECEDLGVDSPSASELFPEAELLFAASPAHDHTQDQGHHSHTPQPLLSQSGIPQPDLDDQIATDQLLPRAEHLHDERELGLGLEDVGIVTVSEDGLQATIELDQEEFARSHPNTTFHSEPTDEGEVQQPFTISGLKGRHITSTIFHANRPAGTVLMTAPQTTVISQATAESSGVHHNAIKYSDIDNMINSLPGAHTNNINLSSVLVKDDGLSRFDNILNDTRELRLSNTASAIVHSAGHATQVIRRVRYGDDKRERDGRFLADEPDGPIAGDDAKMAGEDSSRDATLESTGGDTAGSSPERHADLFWESNSASGRADFSSDSDKCCKSPSDDASTDSSAGAGARAHLRLDSVIKEARGLASDDDAPPLRTYPAPRSLGGKTAPGARRRASARALAKRGSCLCCAGDAPRAKRPRARRPALDLAAADCR